MAKRLVKRSELWLPPHVRRGPSMPPTGRRFVSRRCCCEKMLCGSCTDFTKTPQTLSIVIAGVVEGTCGSCASFNGTFICPGDPLFTGSGCDWVFLWTTCGSPYVRIEMGGGPGPISVYFPGATFRLFSPPEDCETWSNLNIPQFGITSRAGCDFTNATALVTAL